MKMESGRSFRGAMRRTVPWCAPILFVCVVVTGCASSGRGGLDESRGGLMQIEGDATLYKFDLNSDRTAIRHALEAPPAAVWAALPVVYEKVGLRGAGVVDEKHRVFGLPSAALLPRSLAGEPLNRFLTCGSRTTGSSVDTYEVRLRALTQIDSTAEGSLVLTRLDAVARSRGVSGLPVSCSTTGRLERLLVDSLQARISRTGTP